MKAIAIIPARGGSKRLYGKNIKTLCGKPMIAYTIQEAKKSRYIDEVFVTTDDDEIASVSKMYGAKIIKRPDKLATDLATTESVIEHAKKYLGYDMLVVLGHNALAIKQNAGWFMAWKMWKEIKKLREEIKK